MFESTPPDGSDKANEEKLMREYLGGDAGRLGQRQEEEKVELLVKAKTKQVANHFGKHRQTYTRAYETAGYWNKDFPSTQENERDRMEDKVLQRLQAARLQILPSLPSLLFSDPQTMSSFCSIKGKASCESKRSGRQA